MKRNSRSVWISVLFIGMLTSGCGHRLSGEKPPLYRALPSTTAFVKISSGDLDSSEPSTAAAPDGGAYVAWVAHGENQADLYLTHVGADGRTLQGPTRVNSTPGIVTAWRGDPPTIAVAGDGTVCIGWTMRVEIAGQRGTDVMLSISRDGGRTFAQPVRVNDDNKPATHGMHSLGMGPNGEVFVAWLDERNIASPLSSDQASGHHMESNRDVYGAISQDGGKTFGPNTKIATDACPCCKTSVAIENDGRVFVSWRQVLPGDFRHIAVSSSGDNGKSFSDRVIVSDDQWVLKGCPVSGAVLSITPNGPLVALWYSAGENGAEGLYRAKSVDGGKTFSGRELVAATSMRGTPSQAGAGEQNAEVWATDDGGIYQVICNLSKGSAPGKGLLISEKGQMPAATISGSKMFVSYVADDKGRSNVFVNRVDIDQLN